MDNFVEKRFEIASIPSVSNLNIYKNYVNNIPNLSSEEETELAKRYFLDNCLKSAHKLILSQLKMVVRVANEYSGYNLPQEELIQEGNIGLMKAVKNFNPFKKVRLFTYAVVWVKAEMQNYILNNNKIVKLATTKNLKKLFFNLKSTQKELLEAGVAKKDLNKTIAKKLLVEESEVLAANSYFNGEVLSIEYDKDDDTNNNGIEIPEIETPESIMEKEDSTIYLQKHIKNAIQNLSQKEQEIVQARFFSDTKPTHQELSKKYSLSSERIRQLEKSALQKMQKYLQQQGVEKDFVS